MTSLQLVSYGKLYFRNNIIFILKSCIILCNVSRNIICSIYIIVLEQMHTILL